MTRQSTYKPLLIVSTVLLSLNWAIPIYLQAQDLSWPLTVVTAPFRALHREKPTTGADDSIEQLAKQIDWLEHHIDKYGTIVAKHPDVWGESRLMRHRYEYEQQMAAQLEHFEVRMNAALRRSDQAFLGMAFALQSAAGNTASGIPVPTPTTTDVQTSLNLLNAIVPDPNAAVPSGQTAIIDRTKPFNLGVNVSGFSFEQQNLSLEPTIQLDQMSRYLNHLHELRRINEGDDIADSPGYSLNLVRIPVSVLPGKHTRKGYGAEITIIADPYLADDLLPTTFRNLVVSDLVDLLSPALTSLVNSPNIVVDAKVAVEKQRKAMIARSAAARQPEVQSLRQDADAAVDVAAEADRTLLNAIKQQIPNLPPELVVPSSKTRRARLPLPPSQIPEVFGVPGLAPLIVELHRGLNENPVNSPVIHYMDVRAYLNEELQAAYEFLSADNFQELWAFSAHPLATVIRERRVKWLDSHRCNFFNRVGIDDGRFPGEASPDFAPYVPVEAMLSPQLKSTIDSQCCLQSTIDPKICRKATAALAWAVIVESALLNERLIQDMKEASTAKGCAMYPDQAGPFYGPNPSVEAGMAFNEYVRCRWPIRVFALDPVTQDQNVADAFARRRELQVAMALAFASGQMNAQALMRFTRRMEWDMATIELNRTVVGFSHGNDTFGWRFHPRFQTPPMKGTIRTFGETLLGGPSEDSDLRERQLEPGIRECTAIVVMPSFVPYCTFDVRTNWFNLTHPKQSEISMKDTMVLSRSIKSMQQSAAMCAQCAHLYRDGEVHRLLRRVDQLDRELPLQTMQAQIPYENTAGGFELFNTGITDLAPELIGWYGAPGINPNAPTTMYLIGDGFSVHDTRLIAGGRVVPFTLLSRQIMQVEIPTGIQVLRARPEDKANFDEVVDLHLATPYGVSSHLLVPLAKPGAGLSGAGTDLAWKPGAKIVMGFTDVPTTTGSSTTRTLAIQSYFQADPAELVISVPRVAAVPASPTIRFFLRHDQTNIGSFSGTLLEFDTRANEYFITANNLRTLALAGAGDANLQATINRYLQWRKERGIVPVKGSPLVVTVTAEIDVNSRPIPIQGSFIVELENLSR